MEADRHGLFTRPRDLERHVEILRAWGYELVAFAELAERAARGDARGAAALTFDDGFADNLEALAPLLRRLDAPATVFVVSGWLGRRHPDVSHGRIMTGPEVRELAAMGIEIGAHTVTHPDLRAVPRDRALAELRDSKEALEDLLGIPVQTAAYPYGFASDQTLAACAEAGFAAAARSCGLGSWSEPLGLPRQVMHNGCSLTGLRLKRDDRYERLMRTLPGRALRRGSRRGRALARSTAGSVRP